MKSIAYLLLISVSASIAGCATSSGNFCDVSSAYIPRKGEVYVESNKAWIVSHDEYGEKHCGWKP